MSVWGVMQVKWTLNERRPIVHLPEKRFDSWYPLQELRRGQASYLDQSVAKDRRLCASGTDDEKTGETFEAHVGKINRN